MAHVAMGARHPDLGRRPLPGSMAEPAAAVARRRPRCRHPHVARPRARPDGEPGRVADDKRLRRAAVRKSDGGTRPRPELGTRRADPRLRLRQVRAAGDLARRHLDPQRPTAVLVADGCVGPDMVADRRGARVRRVGSDGTSPGGRLHGGSVPLEGRRRRRDRQTDAAARVDGSGRRRRCAQGHRRRLG